MSVFGPEYAETYDLVYAGKPYDAECDLIEALLQRHVGVGGRRILDLGCGTGGHALRLAERGHDVTAVDISEAMLARARRKPRAGGVRFEHGDIRNVAAGAGFDACLIMFAVLGYMETLEDVAATLGTAHRSLNPGGLVIFDAWWAEAVLAIGPEVREREMSSPDSRLVRHSAARLDADRHLCLIDIDISIVGAAGTRRPLTSERHAMRYFDGPELASVLGSTGFELVQLSGFPDVERGPDATTWSVLVVARRVNEPRRCGSSGESA